MRGINKVILVGNVGQSVETRYTHAGKAVANFSVATNRSHKMADGTREKTTEWHRIAAFGRLGEVAGQLLNKGSAIYVEGRIVPQQWTDKDGNIRKSTEIWADNFQLLGAKPKDFVETPILAAQEEEIPF